MSHWWKKSPKGRFLFGATDEIRGQHKLYVFVAVPGMCRESVATAIKPDRQGQIAANGVNARIRVIPQ